MQPGWAGGLRSGSQRERVKVCTSVSSDEFMKAIKFVFSPWQTSHFPCPESEDFTCRTAPVFCDSGDLWVYVEGYSLSAELVAFTAAVYTAGASRQGFGNGQVVVCFLYLPNNGFSTDQP